MPHMDKQPKRLPNNRTELKVKHLIESGQEDTDSYERLIKELESESCQKNSL